MKFGLYTPLPHIVPDQPESAGGRDPGYELARQAVVTADELGFDITLVAQRFLGPDLEAWMLSGALAEATRRIHIMTAIHPSFWIPQVAAKMGSTLDRLSGGRFDINLVTGWWVEEHHMYGAAMLAGEDRYMRAAEFVSVIRRLWTEECVSFHGRFYDLDDAQLLLQPAGAQPQWYGAARSEESGREMVARVCDWWFVPYANDFRQVEENMGVLRQHMDAMNERAAREGRRVRYAVNAFVLHDEDEARARRTAEGWEEHGRGGGVAGIHANGLGTGLIGSRSRILDRLAALEDIGIELALLKFSPVLPGIHDFGEIMAGAQVRGPESGL